MALGTLAAVGIGLQAAGSLYEGFANASRLERQARFAERAAARRAAQIREQGEALEGEAVVAASAGGISLESHSLKDIMLRNARKIEDDAQEALLQGDLEREAAMDAAQDSRVGGFLGGVGGALSSAALLGR